MASCASARATRRPSAPSRPPSCCSSWPRCSRTPSAPGSICPSEMSVEAARAAWHDWLKSERRLAAHTLVAYEHDVATFLGFMTTYLGRTPTLDALGKLKPAEFRAWLAERARQGMARTSTARAFSSVRSFFQFLD